MRITIGVPVYNGADLIVECLECLATQSTQDFQVIISDNASTDGTSDLCADFVRQHKNFQHHCHTETLDVLSNFEWLLQQADTELFMWRADDDLSAPDYVEQLSTAFLDPACRLAIGRVETQRKKPDGSVRRRNVAAPLYLQAKPSMARLYRLMMQTHPSWIYGLWHRQTLSETFQAVRAGYGDVWGWDHLALLPVLLNRQVRVAPDALFLQRLGLTRGPSTEAHWVLKARRHKASRVLANQIDAASLTALERLAARTLSPFWLDKRFYSRARLLKMRLRPSSHAG